ncbi:MAG: nicotinate-nucleotide--dimethylbenzimidazole phosphoribosyltransferase [Methylococcales bacterium]|jgi:nicotinate-nucleotide--dimethylbenzimidazole phosphoribosyltransferase|nr:nicotinate-nucleotide--dimethylbenzimidazole phosphoribosyltransferase [Methylococcales bacterium]MBT7445359.1 nicotinate-nucleotide--dimethylbenzimidazole phosphoribosyltransferase [Methylococcales bacterium]
MTDWTLEPLHAIDETAKAAAIQHQTQLTKPPGSLGVLESVAVRLQALKPHKTLINHCHISIFAADHGIAAENVSAFPQSVTAQMIQNFSNGGAAISVLAKHHQATFEIINVGTVTDLPKMDAVIDARIAPGTENFMNACAMNKTQLAQALAQGKEAAERAKNNTADVFIGGEMGIANTTSATALACSLLQEAPETLVGPGTGLNDTGIAHKAGVIRHAIQHHQASLTCPLSTLQCLGGFEIAALTGAYIRCGQLGLPILVDGFIATVAAFIAQKIQPDLQHWFFFAHQSAEPGHARLMQALHATPLLQLNMRLGEGSGAAIAFPLLQMASLLHHQMATFAQAGVNNGSD